MRTTVLQRGGLFVLLTSALVSGSAADFGPLWADFPLTLEPGRRTEVAGPLFYNQLIDSQRTWAVPPLFSSTRDTSLDYAEYDFLYPVMTYDRFGGQYRWQIFQLFNIAGGATQTETNRDRVTVFPLFFSQRSSDPAENYTALVPFYGHLKDRFSRDESDFVLFPLYVHTRKKDVETWNYPFPILHYRKGDELQGWQFWPVVGHEHKGLTYGTNGFGDVSAIGGHDRWFAVWPLFLRQDNQLGTTNAQKVRGFLPAYVSISSAQRDSTSVLWPFFNKINDREKGYSEWQGPWPFVGFAWGEGKQMSRVLPFFSEAKSPTMKTRSYAWPFYRETQVHSPPLDRRRTRVLFFLYSDIFERNTETGATRSRKDLWPLFTARQDLNGNRRLQVFALLEPLLGNNKAIERDYSPIWSVWRQEHNPRTGVSSQSLLWNFYRRDTAPEAKKTSLLFGLFRYVKTAEGKQVRLFYIPLGRSGGANTSEPSSLAQAAGE